MVFLPAFLDSSNFWNIDHSQLQLQQIDTTTPSPAGPGDGGCKYNNQEGFMATARAGSDAGEVGDDACGGAGNDDCGGSGNSKSMSMLEQARLARLPWPVSGLNCPPCNSTNTKFCYFNNYSLTQPRHFCRSCRRYWTRGGALRNVPVGRGYRRHAKNRAKPKVASDICQATTVWSSSMASTMSSSTTDSTGNDTMPPGLQYPMFGSAPSHYSQFADSFDPARLGLSFPSWLLCADSHAYTVDGCAQQHDHHAHENRMEQWAATQMDNFPIMHAMDHQMSGLPAEAMPITMATMQGMVHLGLQSIGRGNGVDKGGHQFHHPPAKRNHKKQDYPSSSLMYGDVVNSNGCGYI